MDLKKYLGTDVTNMVYDYVYKSMYQDILDEMKYTRSHFDQYNHLKQGVFKPMHEIAIYWFKPKNTAASWKPLYKLFEKKAIFYGDMGYVNYISLEESNEIFKKNNVILTKYMRTNLIRPFREIPKYEYITSDNGWKYMWGRFLLTRFRS